MKKPLMGYATEDERDYILFVFVQLTLEGVYGNDGEYIDDWAINVEKVYELIKKLKERRSDD